MIVNQRKVQPELQQKSDDVFLWDSGYETAGIETPHPPIHPAGRMLIF